MEAGTSVSEDDKKRQRLPLVTLGLYSSRKARSGEIGKKKVSRESDARDEARSVHRKGLFGVIPPEIVMSILSSYLSYDEDLLAVRATCFLAEKLCEKIFSERVVLRISGNRSVRVATVWCKSLKELRINDSVLSNDELCAIARGCSKLEVFSASSWNNVSAYGLGMFFSFLDDLNNLELRFCDALDDWALARLCERCPKLQILCLTGCSGISLEGIKAIAKYCRLTDLNVSFASGITDECITAMFSEGLLKTTLKKLCVAGCEKVTDKSLKELPRLCPHLEFLDMSMLPTLSDLTCASIAKGLMFLKHLKISSCPKIKAGLTVLLSVSKSLETIDAHECARLSNICLLCAKPSNDSLKSINLDGCTGITDVGLNAFKSNFPHVQVSLNRAL